MLHKFMWVLVFILFILNGILWLASIQLEKFDDAWLYTFCLVIQILYVKYIMLPGEASDRSNDPE